MDLKQILEIVKTVCPPSKGTDLFRHQGITFRMLGAGCSRVVYEIMGTPWVIKFGLSESEVDAILAFRSNPAIRRYLPGLIWFNESKDIVIMLHYTLDEDLWSARQRKLSDLARELFNTFQEASPGWHFGDLHEANVGIDKAGRLKVIDCGNFFPQSK